jgi:hypothetical protein
MLAISDDGGAALALEHLQDCRDRGLLGVARVEFGFALWH